VYYGFQGGHDAARYFYLAFCCATGLAGSIFPFMDWFNKREYKVHPAFDRHRRALKKPQLHRVSFFLVLAFSALAPLMHLAALSSPTTVLAFITPIVPSLRSYIIGLVFYVTHFPECFLHTRARAGWARTVHDALGGGSHAIWHVWIVYAIYQRTCLACWCAGWDG
jgi:adiponectin receptor